MKPQPASTGVLLLLLALAATPGLSQSTAWDETSDPNAVTTTRNVGIGTDTPTADLHVRGVGSEARLRLETIGAPYFGAWNLQTDPVTGAFLISEAVRSGTFSIFPRGPKDTLVVRDGRVGIGTATPSAELDIDDGNGLGGAPMLEFNDRVFVGYQGGVGVANPDHGFLRGGPGKQIRLQTDGPNDRLVITAPGLVGIGTETPTDLLHVWSTEASNTLLKIENANATGQRTGARFVNSAATWDARLDTVGDFSVSLAGTDGPLLHLRQSGQVRIGPGSQTVFVVEPSGDLKNDGNLHIGDETISGSGLGTWAQITTDRPNLYLSKPTLVNGSIGSYGQDLVLATDLIERVRISSANGRVGIGGVTNPLAQLHVNGQVRADTFNGERLYGAWGGFEVAPDGNIRRIKGIYYVWPDAHGSAGSVLVNDGTGGLSWSTSGSGGSGHSLDSVDGVYTNVVYVNSSGNVGIGTSGATRKLSVAGDVGVSGKIWAEEVEVEVSVVPDYVFEPDYPLMPLDELEEHVRTERHLPGVPSAAEIAERGNRMGEMQMKLLEKVEELTLYIIDQRHQIEALQSETEELKRSLRAAGLE